MRSLIPHPRLSLLLAVLWVLLNNSVSTGHLALAVVVGLAIPAACRPLLPPLPPVRRPLKLAVYALLVLWDVVVSAFRVAGLTLGPSRRWKPRLVSVPLDVSEPLIVAALAATVTLTPGTVSVRADPAGRRLEVHALGVDDDAAVITQIKTRYERRLKEIFGC